jgi:HEAT repeat protein
MMLLYTFIFQNLLLLPFATFAFEKNPASDQQQQQTVTNHILYLMHTGETAKALQAYQDYRKQLGSNDFELIEQLGLILLDQGYRTRDSEIQRLTLFGAGISTNEKGLYILEKGIADDDPENQLIALNFLTKYQNDRADISIHRAMTSNSLLVRLETAFKLAKKKDPKAIGQIEALMAKVPEQIWSIFPQIVAASGSPEAKKILRKLLTHKNELVRIATILSLADGEHDDFIPHLRRMMTHLGPAQQEACATAVGLLKDENSAATLLHLSKNPHSNVKLAALISLYRLGRHDSQRKIEDIAKQGDLFAIEALGNMPGSEETLKKLLQHENMHVRINAAASLLNLGDGHCLPFISQLLLKDSRDIAIGKICSQGMSLSALKAVPCALQNFEEDPVAMEVSLHIREELLIKSIELPEKDFLALADAILNTQQTDLIPLLTEIFENHPTQPVIDLLKKHQQKVGAPLVRNYCNLALYRMKQPGPYAQNLLEWVSQQRNIDMIQFRPLLPLDQRGNNISFELTPQETSRLLVDAFESFAASQDDKGIDALISIIQTGNPKNKYALIGLLMRAIQ